MSGNRGTDLTASGTSIPNILEVAVTDDTWTAITLGSTDRCKAISVGLRSGANFKVSHLAAGTRYKTVYGSIELDIVKSQEKTLFYVQSAAGADTIECILLD